MRIPSMVLKKYNPPHALSVNFKTFVYSRLVRQAGIEENEKKRSGLHKAIGETLAVTPIDASRVSPLSVLDSRFGSWKKVCGGGCKPEDGFEGCERVVRDLYPANGTLGVFPENPLVFIIQRGYRQVEGSGRKRNGERESRGWREGVTEKKSWGREGQHWQATRIYPQTSHIGRRLPLSTISRMETAGN